MSRGAGSSSRCGGGDGGGGGKGSDGLSEGLARTVFAACDRTGLPADRAGFAAFAGFASFAGLTRGADALAEAFPLCDLPFVFATGAP